MPEKVFIFSEVHVFIYFCIPVIHIDYLYVSDSVLGTINIMEGNLKTWFFASRTV